MCIQYDRVNLKIIGEKCEKCNVMLMSVGLEMLGSPVLRMEMLPLLL